MMISEQEGLLAQENLMGEIGPETAIDTPPEKPVVDERLTVEEMFQRIRRRQKMTRGRFKGELRRAVRDGFVIRDGNVVILTERGKSALGVELS
jgi:hypothetical protein